MSPQAAIVHAALSLQGALIRLQPKRVPRRARAKQAGQAGASDPRGPASRGSPQLGSVADVFACRQAACNTPATHTCLSPPLSLAPCLYLHIWHGQLTTHMQRSSRAKAHDERREQWQARRLSARQHVRAGATACLPGDGPRLAVVCIYIRIYMYIVFDIVYVCVYIYMVFEFTRSFGVPHISKCICVCVYIYTRIYIVYSIWYSVCVCMYMVF